jgi:hypothetical protein
VRAIIAAAAGSVAAYETTPDPVAIVASLARALGLGDGDQAQGAVPVAPVRAQQTGRFYRSRDLGAATIDASLRRGDQGLDSVQRVECPPAGERGGQRGGVVRVGLPRRQCQQDLLDLGILHSSCWGLPSCT